MEVDEVIIDLENAEKSNSRTDGAPSRHGIEDRGSEVTVKCAIKTWES